MSRSLHSLSDTDVLSRTVELTRRERAVTLQLLLHLAEIEERKLHMRDGCSSMFAWCTTRLGYSESAANLRIRTARCLARFPAVCPMLASNEVTLSTVSMVARILTPENGNEVLARIKNKSQREVEAIVAAYEPLERLPVDRVRTVVMRVPVPADTPGSTSPVTNPKCQETYRCNSGEVPVSTPACSEAPDSPGEFAIETRQVFKFAASERFREKFDRIKSLASHRLPATPSFEQVFELAMDHFLEKEDPARRTARRVARHKARKEKRPKATVLPAHSDGAARARQDPRHVSRAVRDAVFLRDQGRCVYQSPGGGLCGSTYALQIDHIIPVARGGVSTANNLRLLCAYHNRLEAERLMGRAYAVRRCAPDT